MVPKVAWGVRTPVWQQCSFALSSHWRGKSAFVTGIVAAWIQVVLGARRSGPVSPRFRLAVALQENLNQCHDNVVPVTAGSQSSSPAGPGPWLSISEPESLADWNLPVQVLRLLTHWQKAHPAATAASGSYTPVTVRGSATGSLIGSSCSAIWLLRNRCTIYITSSLLYITRRMCSLLVWLMI